MWIAELARRLQQPDSAFSQSVHVLDLELDLSRSPPPVPIPAVFFELNREVDLPAARVVALANELFQRSLPARVAKRLGRAVEALPRGGRVVDLGAMLSRPTSDLRVVVDRIGSSQVFDYLSEIGWRGDPGAAAATLDALSGPVASVLVSLDLGETLQPRVGFECHVDSESQPFRQWQVLLDRLVSLGLCTPAKARGLLAWHGISRKQDHPGAWPRHLMWGDRLLDGMAASVISRFLSHIKIVVQPGAAIEAKGYFGFAQDWIDCTKHDRVGTRTLAGSN